MARSDDEDRGASRRSRPHVRISYEAFKDGVSEIRELPFVVGVMGDFCGNPKKVAERFAQREFLTVNNQDFAGKMSRLAPELNLKVEDRLSRGEKREMAVTLKFRSMKDFEPAAIVAQVEPLRALLELRHRLRKAERDGVEFIDVKAEIENASDPAVRAVLEKKFIGNKE